MFSLKKTLDHIHEEWGFPRRKAERISKGYIRRILPGAPICVDCGAHDGADTVELERVLGGTVHAFEPVPEVFDRLCRRVARSKAIRCYQIALSDRTGVADFHVSSGTSDGSSSLMEPQEHLTDHPTVKFERKIQVKCTTLDAWAEANDVARVDFLWLDMQGFEMQMLEASPRILSSVRAVHTEVSTRETYKGVALYPEFRKWMLDKGFQVDVEAIPEGWDMGNVLFARTRPSLR